MDQGRRNFEIEDIQRVVSIVGDEHDINFSTLVKRGSDKCVHLTDDLDPRSIRKYVRANPDAVVLRLPRLLYLFGNRLQTLPRMYVLQTCGDPLCVNPNHIDIYPDTDKVTIEKRTKISAEDAECIRESFAKGVSVEILAEEYGLHIKSIRNIIKKRTWV